MRLVLLFALAVTTLHAKVSLIGYGEIPASARDSLGETIGGLGSAVAYDAKTGCVFMMPDRGAGDGAIDYRPRCYRIRISPDSKNPKRLVARIEQTILFRDKAGRTFTGLLADSHTRPQRGDRRCLDPEAIAVAPDGTLYVSDEYAPSLLQFDRSGRLLREIALPAWFQPRNKLGVLEYNGAAAIGRDENRGAEAMGLLPGGKRAILIFQSALVQDGGKPAGTARVLVIDLRDGKPVAEYAYPFGPAPEKFQDLSVNDLAVIDAHTLLVLERDGLGRDGPISSPSARYKAVWLVDTRRATNLLKLRGQPYDTLVAGKKPTPLSREADVKFVAKKLLFNLPDLLPQLGMKRSRLAAKWEGITLLPPRSKKSLRLLMTADNDFLNPVLHFNGRTIPFPRAKAAVLTQFFEILATVP